MQLMATSAFKPAERTAAVQCRHPQAILAASTADSKVAQHDNTCVTTSQQIDPSMTAPADTPDMGTPSVTEPDQPATITNHRAVEDPSKPAQPISGPERTLPTEHAACNGVSSAAEVSGSGMHSKEANVATPPSQPGNEAADDPAPGPLLSEAPSKPQQPALVTALDSKLTLESAIERIDGLLRRIALEHDSEGFFQEKVLTSIAGCEKYYERIKNPMWFAQIREKLRRREYRTVYQVQADVELICQNAMIFNQKASKVYKNAQNLLKGAKRQFGVEKSLLREAILVLHPQGPECAMKDEAEEEKAQKMPPPPKKPPPKKPSKPIKPSRSHKLVTKPSSGVVHPPAPAALHFIAPIDIQMDLHDDMELNYSSFSETDDERDYTSQSQKAPTETPGASSWGSDAPSEPFAGPPSPSGTRPTEWRLKRQTSEWRIRWLEHRLIELNHQHQRYSAKLDALMKEEKATETPVALEASSVQLDQSKDGKASLEPGRQKGRKRRHVAAGFSGPALLKDNPFMAAHAGLKFSHKELKESADAEVSEEDVNFPARVFAGAEVLEQHMHGLRQQLCQGGYETAHRRKPSRSQAADKGKLKTRQSEKARATKRARQSDDGAGFVVSGIGANIPITLPEKAKTIETPAFREITAEDRNDWVALRERQREYELLKEQRRNGKDVPLDGFESSSSEDTSDEKYYKMHAVGEAMEQACDSKPNKKKKKLKTGKDRDQEANVAASDTATPSEAVLVKTGSLKGQRPQNEELTVTVNVQNLPQVSTPAATLGGPVNVSTQVSIPGTKGTPHALPSRESSGIRGRGRRRGRPSGTTKAAMSAPSKRVAGPGRGHKSQVQKSSLGTPASAPPQVSQPAQAAANGPSVPQKSATSPVDIAPAAPQPSPEMKAEQKPAVIPVSVEPGSG